MESTSTGDDSLSFRNDTELDGTIVSIVARNFFCHDNLEVKLNKNINFIVGRNGSGKSAILTALVVGLGGRANATNRGSSLKSFIKNGANSATVEIQIKNSTVNAFKHDLYGDVITVVRTINASGGSAYKIKSASGEVISTKYQEVVAICSCLDIQVDNPICVLNQDDARNFHAADSAKKYSLYRRATNMDLIEENYNRALATCAKAKSMLDQKTDAFTQLEKEVGKLKRKCKEFESREEVHRLRRSLQDEFYWAEIVQLELELQTTLKNYAKQKAKIEKIVEDCRKLEESQDEHSKSADQIQAEVSTILQKIEDVNSRAKAAFDSFNESKKEWKSYLAQLQKKKEQIAREQAKISDLSKEVNIANNANSANEAENLKHQKTEYISQLKEAKSRKELLEHEISQMRGAISHHLTQHDSLLQNNRKLQNSISHVKSQINELNIRGKDNLAVYGSDMIDLVNAIKEGHRRGEFSAMPRGPIGSYLKTIEKKWSGALEHILGWSIMGFCVNNENDSRKLFSIMKGIFKNKSQPTITTSKFFDHVHNVSGNDVQAPPGYRSALNSLKVDDPVIANFLIDNLRMESILLVPTDEEAMSFCTDIAKVPKRCSKIVTLDSAEYYPMPNYRSYGGSGKGSKYLQVNTSDRRKQLQEEIEKITIELNKSQLEIKKIDETKQELTAQENSLELRLRKLVNGCHNLEDKISNIDSSLLNMEGGHIKVLMEELNVAKEKISQLQEEESTMVIQELNLRNNAKEAESNFSELRTKKRKLEDDYSKLKDELNEKKVKADRSKSEIEMAKKSIASENRILEELNEKASNKKADIQDKIISAETLCSRIEQPRAPNIIMAELKKTEVLLKSIDQNESSKHQITNLLIEKQTLLTSTEKMIKDLESLIKLVKKTTQNHLDAALKTQSLTANRVQFCFHSILTLRDYSGSMIINNDNGTLEIHCTGRDSASVRTADTTGSLSGGERSYATVAFIMALWDCMELPFYFLDEFDVFMDNINRKITMELLIQHAGNYRNRQYVFLTPQDASNLVASDTISLHRLADPVRSSA